MTAFVPSNVAAPVADTALEPVSTITEAKPAETTVESAESASEDVTVNFPIAEEKKAALSNTLKEDFTNELIAYHQKALSKPDAKPAAFGMITCPTLITDRAARGQVHQIVRELFGGRIESSTEQATSLLQFFVASRASQANPSTRSDWNQPKKNPQLKGKMGWDELGGQHCHFTLYKENKDTMEVIGLLAKLLKTKPQEFSFAGTKDRRAATVQRVSVYRQTADKLANLNRSLRGARLGNFTYAKQRLELGELAGNVFTITLRDCTFGGAAMDLDEAGRVEYAKQVVQKAAESMMVEGFINYFGLQRFGTHIIGTHHIGMLILQEKFKDAVDAILHYNQEALANASNPESLDKIGRDELARSKAIHIFRTTGNSFKALDELPRRFNAETAVIRHLGSRNHATDYLGALQGITRNLKTMFVHAYQSRIWNEVATKRWETYGSKVVEGDLILVDRSAVRSAAMDEVDENGEIVINAQGDDAAVNSDDVYERARPLTAEEAASGKYTVFDIVLPSPGYDMEYPANVIGDFYKEYMSSEEGGGLDPGNMRRAQKDFSLSGAYRKFMATIGNDFDFKVKTYSDEIEQLVKTDWEKLQEQPGRTEKDNRTGHDNARNDAFNGGQNGRGGRGGRGNHFAARGNSHGGRSHDGPSARGAEFDAATARNKADPRVSMWKIAPAKLQEEEALAAEAARLAEPTRVKVTSAPAIEEKWMQTSAENASVYTGVQEEAVHKLADDKMDVDKKVDEPVVTVVDKTDAMSVASSTDRDTAGGVPLEPEVKADFNAPEDEVTAVALPLLPVEESKPKRIAVIVTFSLGSSQYATIALRELMSGVKTYKPDYSSGR